MAITEAQKDLAEGLLIFGVEEEAVPYLVAMLKEPQHTEEMIDFLLDNTEATREDILLKVVQIRNSSDSINKKTQQNRGFKVPQAHS